MRPHHEIHPSLTKRKIIHIDMDAFYASIEVRDDPSLRGKPIAVGGSREGRGVISTCSYEARAFGVHSAMPTSRALRLCPQLILRPSRFDVYRQVSQQIRDVFHSYSSLVEPLSLDEAFVDVTHHQGITATKIALEMKARILEVTKLTASTGVGPNKMIAKIASDLRKPDGITIVPPENVFLFMQGMPVKKIPGIGPKSAERLARKGIHQCRDVLTVGQIKLVEWFGQRFGEWLFLRAQGIDERAVETDRKRKSLGAETTFSKDITDADDLFERLKHVVDEVCRRLEKARVRGKTLTLKVKYGDFKQITRSLSLPHGIANSQQILEHLQELILKTEWGRRPVRLVGVSLSHLEGYDESSGTRSVFQPQLFSSSSLSD
ncbi:DNA polymerase IV [Pseudobacteriovorax antillogorgiicola]|uniref:DNA polymerase IV n=1 Tax=Pseudobacteriovorax antillogorgiicola TaxID=1513793 RepID=A0A1Y6C014_9BACT|nr:DNA polymerase IV [Pseudobacteriovorax antillogorgiicola]TCS52442.1 DNA polymerase-4 [Pseudobacteriovorax antillogorgiicola]SMF28614.1 DNA polymerase-4 [Pseudobacteriovorax antillogorgiicola]